MANAVGAGPRHDHAEKRTLAQWFCLLGGAAFLLAGLAGFLVDSSFDVGSPEGDPLLGLEVNGWHNVVHILSGLFLLAMSRTAATARAGALAFGAAYLLVTIIGFIQGDSILGLLAINGADNIFHLVTSLLALAAGLMSPTTKSHGGRTIATDDRGRFDRTADGVGTGFAHEGQRDAAAASATTRRR